VYLLCVYMRACVSAYQCWIMAWSKVGSLIRHWR